MEGERGADIPEDDVMEVRGADSEGCGGDEEGMGATRRE